MGRITRTVVGTRARVLTVNKQVMTADNKDFIIGGTFDSHDKLLKALKKTYDNDTQVLSAVISTEKCEKLYGLDESVFMKYAVELDPKTRKPVTADTETQPVTVDTDTQPNNNDGVGITAPITITEVSGKASKKN